ncbi:MAG: DUF4286 family protein [Dehalococcoidia bacterium]
MEGRKPTGVLIVMVNNTEPSKEDEFNKWYNEIHIPDVVGTGFYYHATRFVNTNPKPGEAKYLAIYETDQEDPIGAFAEMQKQTGDMDIWPHLEAVFVQAFKYTGSEKRTPGAAKAAASATS